MSGRRNKLGEKDGTDLFSIPSCNNGFTLMEVLIAITILAIIMAIVYGSFVQTRIVIGKTESAVDGLRGVRFTFNRIVRDLSMSFISTTDENTFLVGTDDYMDGYPNDSIDFTSYSNMIRELDAKESDQTEVGYYIKRGFEGESVLMKREKRRIDADPMYGGNAYELSEDILGLDFRYLDNDAWLESWDSRVSNHKLPEAVEVTIVAKDISGAEKSYRTIVEIPLGRK